MTPKPESSSTLFPRQSPPLEHLPAWRLWVPLLCQTAIILAAPAGPFYTQLVGKTVVLQTVPVDPYDLLRGYSQTLSYDISLLKNLRRLPGWQELVKQQAAKRSTNIPAPSVSSSDYLASGTKVYVILEAPASDESSPPKAWKAVRVSSDRPTSLPANQIALKGKFTGDSIEYGLETYYMPESQRDEINEDISQAQAGRQQQSVVVEVKVDTQGRAVPISFWVRDVKKSGKAPRNYRF
ncbi:MAG: GDYXXLXY domain-containing protein [Aphanothece sp. CMT-3BRIN-NPC111]|nr:GDYXXLXY domain-containing protein [Aphanothece sp. CMT-3BRIN-NPC111]